MWLNQAWMKQLNLKTPTTLDELYDVLVAFRDGDPNGNNIKDEIPLLVSASSDAARVDFLFGLFGTLENNQHIRVQDGKVIFTPQEDAYYDALQWLHKLYAEGLMNQEYFTEDYQQFLAKGNAETCVVGLVLEWYIDNIILKSNVQNFAYLEPVTGPNGTPIWSKAISPNSPQGTLNGFTITKSCKNPELLVKWYDYINSNLDILNLWTTALKSDLALHRRRSLGAVQRQRAGRAPLPLRFVAPSAPAPTPRCMRTPASAVRRLKSMPTVSPRR